MRTKKLLLFVFCSVLLNSCFLNKSDEKKEEKENDVDSLIVVENIEVKEEIVESNTRPVFTLSMFKDLREKDIYKKVEEYGCTIKSEGNDGLYSDSYIFYKGDAIYMIYVDYYIGVISLCELPEGTKKESEIYVDDIVYDFDEEYN